MSELKQKGLINIKPKAPKSSIRSRGGAEESTRMTTSRNHTTVHFAGGDISPTPELTTYGGIKLGWIQGVLIPCLLNIWGVMLFLRIAWVVAQAGIGLSILIIFISGVVCVITTLSLSAISTNGEIQGGGVYYLVSRSLGAEFGASVGIIFAFANAVAASMNTIGFCDSLNELLKSHGVKIIDNSVNDVRIVGAIALFVMCVICAIGMDWETKTQNFLIITIVLAICNYIIGSFIGPRNDDQRAKGFVGISAETAERNWRPDFRFSEGREHNFFSVFAVYFPAVTGVQAGANICGDLRDPASAIPKGTLTALLISISSYLTMAVLCGVGALRDASGDSSDLSHTSLETCKPDCDYGLHNNYEIMHIMALWGPLIYAGCWAATLSTALTNLLSVPRLIQALGIDRIYPGLIFFSKPYGRHGEPYRGYVLTFLVSLLFLLIADLNTIAPLITNFYLASYALINFCTFHAAFVKHISWRPTFRFYNTWLSLAGFLMCTAIMIIISWVMALVTICIFMTLYLLVLYRKPDASWGSSTDAQRYQETVSAILQITQRARHIKAYNPQLIAFAGKPYMRPALLDIGQLITKSGSFMIVADVHVDKLSSSERMSRLSVGNEWLNWRKDRAFYVVIDGFDFERGAMALMQSTGLGRFMPNIMLIGFKNNWRTVNNKSLGTYVQIIRNGFEQQLAVGIFRGPGKEQAPHDLPLPRSGSSLTATSVRERRMHSQVLAVMNSDSDIDLGPNPCHTDAGGNLDNLEDAAPENSYEKSFEKESHYNDKPGTLGNVSVEAMPKMNPSKPLTFSPDSNLDTWWLYDDGGLNILLPYIIALRGNKDKMRFRIFALPRSGHKNVDAQNYIEYLLAKFRIEYTQLNLVSGIQTPPSEASRELFDHLLDNHRTTDKSDILLSETELTRLQTKTNTYLRLRDLLLQHSFGAGLIVMTLPFPRKDSVSASLYMTWLEVLSRDLPPVLFVRGNGIPVLDA